LPEKKDDAELQLFLQEVENEKEMNDYEIAYDSDNSIEIEFSNLSKLIMLKTG
jgi:hypothetical protein